MEPAKLVVLVLGLAACFAFMLVAYVSLYAWFKGGDRPNENERPTFFAGANFTGIAAALSSGYYNGEFLSTNKTMEVDAHLPLAKIRSVMVPRGYLVVLYNDSNMKMDKIVLHNNVKDLKLLKSKFIRSGDVSPWQGKVRAITVSLLNPLQCSS